MLNPLEIWKLWGYSGSANTWRPIQSTSDGRLLTSKFNDSGHTRTLHTITLASPSQEYTLAAALPAITDLTKVVEVLIDNSYGAGDVRYSYTANRARDGVHPFRILPADGFERLIEAPIPAAIHFRSAIADSIIVLEIVRKA